MLRPGHYVPVVRWKRGEQSALRRLGVEERSVVTPLLEIPSGEFVQDGAAFGNTVQKAVAGVSRNWGTSPAFLDLSLLCARLHQTDVVKVASMMHESARAAGLCLIPVVDLGQAPALCGSVKQIASVDHNGACIRVRGVELQSVGLRKALGGLLARLELVPEQVDLVLDSGLIDLTTPSAWNSATGGAFEYDWRTMTTVAGSFPKDLTNLPVGQHELPRVEWIRWRFEATELLNRFGRIPIFGDYMTLHPVFSEPQPGMNPSASIRYTSDDYWVVMRGEGLRNKDGPGHAQYFANAELLCGRKEYCGSDYCFGDNYIWKVGAHNVTGPGSPETWLAAGVNHHLTFAVRQISGTLDSVANA